MNFGTIELDDDTLAFWKECRAFFTEHVTEEVHDEERRTGGGFNLDLHLAMGERGWVAPRWPTEHGGAGLDALRAQIIDLERVRSEAPSILATTTLLPPIAIRKFGSPQLQQEILPGVADGTVRICLGYTEPDCGSDLAAVRTRAVRDGDEWVITGQKMFTTGAQFSQYCFCLTRTNPDVAKHKGLTVFLVPLGLPKIEITPIETLGGERTNFVHFDDARIPDHYRLGEVDDGWAVVSAPLAQEHQMKDGDADRPASIDHYNVATRRALDAVTNWLASQQRSDGTTAQDDPGAIEALARIALGVEVCDVTPGAMRRIVSAETLVRAASDLLDIVGPAGSLAHGATGSIADSAAEYAFRFAPGTTIYGGSTEVQRNLIAEHLLGLPRSTPRG
jgi:3-oxocholest-4-en-26-oyl-CoA dehydrogenase alpha subunit